MWNIDNETHMWMIRASGGQYVEKFLEEGIAGLGWEEIGSLKNIRSREQIIEKVRVTWPEYKPMKAVVSGSQLNKMANVIKTGDKIITYNPSTRTYHVGVIQGDYHFNPDAEERNHQRKVLWQGKIDRDKLSVPTKNTLGSTLTIFELSDSAANEIDGLLSGKVENTVGKAETLVSNEVDIDVQNLLEDYKSKAKEFIKDRIIALDWEEMQELVAGLLRAMGYKTRVSPQGADRGKDIVASPDGLGLEQPRIVVEVKHRPNIQMRSQEIRSFLGGRHKDDRGLYISTGGFSKDAKYEADRASIPLTLMDSDDLVNLVIENYEALDMESRALLPLTKIYWPSE